MPCRPNVSRTGLATAAARIVTSREARELRAQFSGRTTHGKTHHHRHGRPAHHRQRDPALPPRQAGEKGGRRVRGPPQIGHSRRQAGRRPGLSRDEKAVVQDLRRLWGSHREIVVVCSDNELLKGAGESARVIHLLMSLPPRSDKDLSRSFSVDLSWERSTWGRRSSPRGFGASSW